MFFFSPFVVLLPGWVRGGGVGGRCIGWQFIQRLPVEVAAEAVAMSLLYSSLFSTGG